MKETLIFTSVIEHPDLVSESVLKASQQFPDIQVAEINPEYMNGLALSEHYDVLPDEGVNCVVVRGRRGEVRTTAAVLIPVGYRADLNGMVCEQLDAKKVSLAPLDDVIKETGMEYGSITPIGLPASWRMLIDSRLMEKEWVIVGGGKQISKLRVPTSILKELPNAEILEGLANPA